MVSLLVGLAMAPPPGYSLVWFDDFNYKGLPNSKYWAYETGFVRNGEKQFYTNARAENAYVSDGKLTIAARKDNFEGHEISSASLHTNGKLDFTYGYVEVKAKIPGGKGTWPAIWTLGSNIGKVGWPLCGEIDIMEYVGHEAEKVYFNVHGKDANKGSELVVPKPTSDFHIYGMEWTKNYLRWTFDGKEVMTYTKTSDDTAKWPFAAPQYLILNLAIGGNWGGQKGIDDSIFPSKYEVDYVRVYQK